MLTLGYMLFCWGILAISFVGLPHLIADPLHQSLVHWLQKLLVVATLLFSGGAVMIELVHRFKSSYTGFAFLYTVLLYSIGVGLALALSEPLEQSHQNTAIAVLGVFLLLQVSLQAWFAAKKLKNS